MNSDDLRTNIINKASMPEVFEKASKVIESCKTIEHTVSALNYIELALLNNYIDWTTHHYLFSKVQRVRYSIIDNMDRL